MAPLFDLVLKHVAPPKVERRPVPHARHASSRANPYLGRIITGRIFSGSIKPNQPVKVLDREGNLVEQGPGLEDPRLPRHRAHADRRGGRRRHRRHRGPDEVQRRRHASAIPKSREPLHGAADRSADAVDDVPRQRLPLAGTEGDKVTSRVIRDRLLRKPKAMSRCGSRKPRQGFHGRRRAAANCSSRS